MKKVSGVLPSMVIVVLLLPGAVMAVNRLVVTLCKQADGEWKIEPQ